MILNVGVFSTFGEEDCYWNLQPSLYLASDNKHLPFRNTGLRDD